MSSLQDRIDAFNAEITSLNNEITMIEGETGIGATAVQEMMDLRKQNLETRKTRMTARRDRLQSIVDNPITAGQQTVIDGINTLFNNQYSAYLDSLANMTVTDRNNFFSVYNDCDSDVSRECVIRHFFAI